MSRFDLLAGGQIDIIPPVPITFEHMVGTIGVHHRYESHQMAASVDGAILELSSDFRAVSGSDGRWQRFVFLVRRDQHPVLTLRGLELALRSYSSSMLDVPMFFCLGDTDLPIVSVRRHSSEPPSLVLEVSR